MRTLLLLAAAAGLSAGCALYPSQVDGQFGASLMNARAAQVVTPGAAARQRTQSIDATVAVSAVDAYRKSFDTPPPPTNVFNIGLGAGNR